MRRIARGVLRAAPLPAQALILDAGCGAGGGLTWLTEFGRPTGIDLHPRAVHHAAQRCPRVARASIQQLPFLTATFDLVTSFEVLYHLSVVDDVAALRECARVLRPGGWLMVRVPAHDWLRGAHDRQVHTRQRYSSSELRTKIAHAGLRLRRLTPVGAWLLPLAAARRLWQKRAAVQTDVVLPAPWLNRLLAAALTAEGVWLSRFDLPFGLSILALAQKEAA
jgi:SAM-dependent methyltransferase